MLRYSDSVLNDARRRIEQVRKKDVDILVQRDGQRLPDAVVRVRMKDHAFLFGAVCYAHGTYGDPAQEQRFTELFTNLFNYTMVPFHWKWYEPQRGQYKEPYTGNLVRWASENGLKKKLHALIWFPYGFPIDDISPYAAGSADVKLTVKREPQSRSDTIGGRRIPEDYSLRLEADLPAGYWE